MISGSCPLALGSMDEPPQSYPAFVVPPCASGSRIPIRETALPTIGGPRGGPWRETRSRATSSTKYVLVLIVWRGGSGVDTPIAGPTERSGRIRVLQGPMRSTEHRPKPPGSVENRSLPATEDHEHPCGLADAQLPCISNVVGVRIRRCDYRDRDNLWMFHGVGGGRLQVGDRLDLVVA